MAMNPAAGFPGALPWHSLAVASTIQGELPMKAVRDPAEVRFAAKADAMFKRGIGDQLGVHLYDTPLTFDINFSEGLGGLFHPRSQEGMYAGVGVLMAGFFTPYYLTLDVRDAKVVDEFLEELARNATKQATSLSNAGPVSSFEPRFKTDRKSVV